MNATTAREKEKRDAIFDIMDILKSPILTHTTSWADCIPKRLLQVIPLARTEAALKHEELATLPECVAFIMTRTFEAPMTSEWTNIYTWLGCYVCERYWNENHWDSDIANSRTLTDYEEKYLLRPLRLWIYEKRRQILKQRIRDEVKETPKPVIVAVKQQLTLFDG